LHADSQTFRSTPDPRLLRLLFFKGDSASNT
jgi:hypothetical protein